MQATSQELTALYAGLETLGTLALVLDAQNSILYITTSAGQLLDISPDKVVGQTWANFSARLFPAVTLGQLSETPQRLSLERRGQNLPLRISQKPLVGLAASLVCLEDLTAEEAREYETLQMFSRLQTQADDLFALYQISQFLATAQELDQLCAECLRELERLTNAEISCLYLTDFGGELRPQIWHGLTQVPANQPDSPAALAWFKSIATGYEIFSLPLLAEDAPVGLALLACQESTPRDLHFLTTVAKEMGAAMRAMANRQALLAKDQNLEAVIAGTTDAIIQVSVGQTVCGFNPAAEKLTGYRAAEVLGRACGEVLGCSEGRGCGDNCLFGQVTNSGEPIPYAEIPVAGTLGLRHVAASVAPLSVNSPSAPVAVAILRDITRQKEIEQMKTDFTTMISHELRTPLALLRGYTETLQHLALSPAEKEYCINGIGSATAQLQKLIEQVLTVSRIEAGRMILQLESLNVPRVAAQSVKSLGEAAARRVRLVFPPTLPCVVADAVRLEQVLTNLLENALKYSPSESLITVSAEPAGRQVQIQVVDEGIGVPAEELEALFNKFERASNARQLQLPGTGLGLFICRNIVEAHGGTIKMISNLGKGSCVTFWLPADEGV